MEIRRFRDLILECLIFKQTPSKTEPSSPNRNAHRRRRSIAKFTESARSPNPRESSSFRVRSSYFQISAGFERRNVTKPRDLSLAPRGDVGSFPSRFQRRGGGSSTKGRVTVRDTRITLHPYNTRSRLLTITVKRAWLRD